MFSSATLLVVVLLKEKSENGSLREKCPNRSYFWTAFSCTWPEYRNTGIQSEYRKIRTRNNSVFGHFSRIKKSCLSLLITILVFLSEKYIALPAAQWSSFNKERERQRQRGIINEKCCKIEGQE